MELNRDHHLTDIEIEKYSLGDIPEPDLGRVEEHLLICESCQNQVAQSDDYVATMQAASARLRQETTQKKSFLRFGWAPWTPAFAISALLLVSAAAWLGTNRLRSRANPQPAFAMDLAAVRGNGLPATAPAGRPLTLQLDLTGLQPQSALRLEVVDQLGKPVWQSSIASEDAKAVANLPQLTGGLYFVRTYDASGKLLREYGLDVRNR